MYAVQEEAPDATNWRKVVVIVRAAFRDGTLADESMWQTVVFNPNGDYRDFQGLASLRSYGRP